ncbi:uncharacterized protein DUF2220 [Natranaerovirga hydrolytica]|uniref:Uncharacterized protein DUF2220 n=1 Tax=Natranaerovirga hydrolytica TaxID=680378 RepID=A0A4R1MM42_9FIRM|nr:Wadjet anti-phage system protein JetD domain-containing protein [Natranaerovirga hydrolytica]TCK93160.1 uncharacterized protein DUF2220 [Natranaerovirga hydrolytica]
MKSLLLKHIQSKKITQMPLTQLQNILPGDTEYTTFANVIKEFETLGILRPVKKHGTNNKSIPLYYTYRINKAYFKDQLLETIQSYRLKVHPSIQLQVYFSLDAKQWEKDLPYIKKIDQYLKKNGLPLLEVSAPERSYALVEDEKWIDFKGGKSVLQRIGLWDKLKIAYNTDPLMLAIHPKHIQKEQHAHLIVENKATFYEMLEGLEKTAFTSLVYGSGWKIVSNAHRLEQQMGLKKGTGTVYYFGDLDHEGITIWHILNEKQPVIPAIPFYQELLKKEATQGKSNQKIHSEAVNHFIKYFPKEDAVKIKTVLASKYYYPQEGLTKEELALLWRQGQWI